MTEDEMVGWHDWLNGHEFEQAPRDGEGQGSLACCSPWDCKELDTPEPLNSNNNLPCQRIFSLLNIFYFKNEIYLLKYMFLPTTLNFYLNVFSSQERKRFGDDFPQLSNDYLPAKILHLWQSSWFTSPKLLFLSDFTFEYFMSSISTRFWGKDL